MDWVEESVVKKSSSHLDYPRQAVKGVFFCKTSVTKEDCRKLVQDLGCAILLDNENKLTIQTSRARLQELKTRYMASDDDKAQISSRLQEHFERILIGGTAR
jgi:hypothetical protein